MSDIYAKLDGWVGLQPGTTRVYHEPNRPGAPGGWEALTITKRGDYYDVDFVAAKKPLRLDFMTRELVTGADHNGWGGQWNKSDDGKTLWIGDSIAKTVLTLQGYKAVVTMSRVHINDWTMVDEAGKEVVWAHTTGFRDLDRLSLGQDIRPVLAQSQDQGATGRRVFAMKWNWAVKVNGVWGDGPEHFWPNERTNYFESVEKLADLYAEYGHYLNLVVFVNARSVMPDINAQLQFWGTMVEIARKHSNIILSLANEMDAHDNNVDVGRFPQPDGVLASSGSNGGGANPPKPFWGGPWGYCELHPERRADRPSLGTTTLHFAIHGYSEGSDSWPGTQRFTVASEPYGFDEENEPGRRTNEPQVAWLLGLGCTWGSGGTGLSADGIDSVLLRSKQDACMRLFIAGVKAGRR